MSDGMMSQRTEGMPQGGPLSPLLSNILLDDLDRELERRGHIFCRMPMIAIFMLLHGALVSGSWRLLLVT